MSGRDCGEEAAHWISIFLSRDCRLIEQQDRRTCKLEGIAGQHLYAIRLVVQVYLVNKIDLFKLPVTAINLFFIRAFFVRTVRLRLTKILKRSIPRLRVS